MTDSNGWHTTTDDPPPDTEWVIVWHAFEAAHPSGEPGTCVHALYIKSVPCWEVHGQRVQLKSFKHWRPITKRGWGELVYPPPVEQP
jgi:hypothetical protein